MLPIGGLKEKLLAAHRGGIKEVIIPEENRKDLTEIPQNILNEIKVHPVNTIEEVLALALVRSPFVVSHPLAVMPEVVGDPLNTNDMH